MVHAAILGIPVDTPHRARRRTHTRGPTPKTLRACSFAMRGVARREYERSFMRSVRRGGGDDGRWAAATIDCADLGCFLYFFFVGV